MVELHKQDIKEYSRQSSKGNQLKWNVGNMWYKADYTGYEGLADYDNRISFLVEQTIRITGLKDFGKYMSKLMTIDAFFLNEDRYTHNIAVLLDEEGNYHECPVFDHGASLLADTKMDYPLAAPLSSLMQKVQAKTFCPDFEVQLDAVERLYGQQFHFTFGRQEISILILGVYILLLFLLLKYDTIVILRMEKEGAYTNEN